MRRYFFILCIASNVYCQAQTALPSDGLRENQQSLQSAQFSLQMRAAEQLQSSASAADIPLSSSTAHSPFARLAENACLPQHQLAVRGISLIEYDSAPTDYACLNSRIVQERLHALTAAYLKQGYLGTQFELAEEADRLWIVVKEGRIREISGQSRGVNIEHLFPQAANAPLNMAFLDQGIDQAAKVTGNRLSMDVFPHSDGSASIVLKNDADKAWAGSLTLDNEGGKPNREMLRANVSVGSPLGLSDVLYIGAYTNTLQRNDAYSRGANVFYSMPYGAWSFQLYGGASYGNQGMDLPLAGRRFDYRSRSLTGGAKLERMVSRDATHILSAYAAIDYLRQETDFAGTRLQLQSPRLTALRGGLTYSKRFPTAVLLADAGIEQGIGGEDEALPVSRFSRWYVNAQWLQSYGARWRSRHELNAQYSPHLLYAAKAFEIADRYAVRGFKDLSLKGRSGATLRNTLYFPSLEFSAHSLEPYAGLDIGWAREQDHSQQALGLSAGLNWTIGADWRLNTQIARGFGKTPDDKKQETRWTAQLQWRF